jgi:nitrite reductase/ring-hydroxylating ferredoxin subunit
MVGDAAVVLVRHNGRVFGLAEHCAHQGGPLSEGELDDGVLRCPWHDSQYRVEDGSVVHGPSTFDQPCYDTRVMDGFIEVKPRASR